MTDVESGRDAEQLPCEVARIKRECGHRRVNGGPAVVCAAPQRPPLGTPPRRGSVSVVAMEHIRTPKEDGERRSPGPWSSVPGLPAHVALPTTVVATGSNSDTRRLGTGNQRRLSVASVIAGALYRTTKGRMVRERWTGNPGGATVRTSSLGGRWQLASSSPALQVNERSWDVRSRRLTTPGRDRPGNSEKEARSEATGEEFSVWSGCGGTGRSTGTPVTGGQGQSQGV
ncbi:unnamed protein product [Lota lota]